jgi:hypothetical protein
LIRGIERVGFAPIDPINGTGIADYKDLGPPSPQMASFVGTRTMPNCKVASYIGCGIAFAQMLVV